MPIAFSRKRTSAFLLLLSTMTCSALAHGTECVSGGSAYAVVDQSFAAFAKKEHLPGLVYGVVSKGKLVHCATLGVGDVESRAPVTFDTVFRIASMTKSFTALAVLKLRDAGRVSLELPAQEWVPELARAIPVDPETPKIRVRDLLGHTAGFVTDDPWGDRQLDLPEADFTKLIAGGIPVARPPGTAYEYSNYGYALLGRIVSNASKMPYQRYIDREILQPLKMTATTWEFSRIDPARRAKGYRYEDGRWSPEPVLGDGAFGAMGGLHTSARDYVQYVSFLLASWSERDVDGSRILAKSTRRELGQGAGFPSVSPLVDASDPASCAGGGVYGYGMRIYSDCRFNHAMSHSGGLPGYGSNVLLLTDYDVGIFAFANRTYAPMARAVRQAAAELHDTKVFTKREAVPSPGLQRMRGIIAAIYAAGAVRTHPDALAGNLLLDFDASRRDREITALKVRLGTCTEGKLEAEHALAGEIRYRCEHGTLLAKVVLAPVPQPSLQTLELSAED